MSVRERFELESMLGKEIARAAELLAELEEIAPDVAAWLEVPERKRGRMPRVPADRRAEVFRVMTELRGLVARL